MYLCITYVKELKRKCAPSNYYFPFAFASFQLGGVILQEEWGAGHSKSGKEN